MISNKKNLIYIFIFLLIFGFLIYYSNYSKKLSSPAAPFVSPETPSKKKFEATREIKIIARQWQFEPSEIRVKRGEKVKLVIESVDVAHGFFIPELGINKRIEPGRKTEIEFISDKKGQFLFICNVLCGSGHSQMRGSLIIE